MAMSSPASRVEVDSTTILPPRRAGAPPRLLGDHPEQIAQTSIPKLVNVPENDPQTRRRQVRAARRWDNAKMVALLFIVFGLIGGMIQWTRTSHGVKSNNVAESVDQQVEGAQVQQVEPERQVATNDDGKVGAWHAQ